MYVSPINISHFAPRLVSGVGQTLQQIVNANNFINAWSRESTIINGTTTTVNDMVGALHLANAAATAQPTATANSLIFDGIDDIVKISNLSPKFRSIDAIGEFVTHFKVISGTNIIDMTTHDPLAATNNTFPSIFSGNIRFNVTPALSANFRHFRGSTIVSTGVWYTVSYGCTGSSYYMIINGNNETITMVVGANDGLKWMRDLNGTQVAIGSIVTSGADFFSNIEYKFSGYRTHVSIADSIATNLAIHNKLI